MADSILQRADEDPEEAAETLEGQDEIAAAVTGATAGSVLGPVGVVMGAAVGAVTSAVNARHHHTESAEHAEKYEEVRREEKGNTP